MRVGVGASVRAAVPVAAATALLVAACAGDETATVDGLETVDGVEVVVAVDGLDRPTQLAMLPDGRLLLAELAGAEDEGVGRVVAIDLEGDGGSGGGGESVEVLFEGLQKPTGVAVVDDQVWVMEERTLSRGSLDGGELTEVLGPLPYNGRSSTTLTPTPDGRLLLGTSGSLRSGVPVADSGTVWEHEPGVGSTAISSGFKNPYGHVFDGDGGLWVTEMSDGRFDGAPAPDELVAVEPGIDHGWPRCIGDRVAVADYGATAAECAGGPPSHALFAPGATPTSVAVAPWDDDLLVVALWMERRLVTVPRAPGDEPHEPVEILAGGLRPQHLLADGERLLVVDHEGGRILAVTVG